MTETERKILIDAGESVSRCFELARAGAPSAELLESHTAATHAMAAFVDHLLAEMKRTGRENDPTALRVAKQAQNTIKELHRIGCELALRDVKVSGTPIGSA